MKLVFWRDCMLFLVGVSIVTGSIFLLSTQSIRLDESQSIWIATKSLPTIFRLTGQDVHGPLYLTILHFWLQVWGNEIFTARLLSLLFYFLTLPVLYILYKQESDKRTALVTVVLFSLSPFILWFGNEARMYSLFTFITSLNHLFFLRLYHTKGRRYKTAFFLSLLAGVLTHYFFFILIVSQILFVTLRPLVHLYLVKITQYSIFDNSFSGYKQFLLSYFWILFCVAICSSPWFIYFFLLGGAANTQPLIPPPTTYTILQVLINFLFGFQDKLVTSVLISLWPLFVLVLFFVFTKRKQVDIPDMSYFAFITFIPIVIVFFLSYLKPLFLARYLIFITPTLFFMISWLLLGYSKKISAVLLTLFLFILLSLLFYQNLSFATPVKEDYQGVAEYLESNGTGRDIIAVSAPFTIYPLEYTYKGSARITTIPKWDRYTQGSIPSFNKKAFVQQLQQFQKMYENLFVVLSYDQGYEDDIRSYLDSHFQLRGDRTFSPGLEVREYQLRYD